MAVRSSSWIYFKLGLSLWGPRHYTALVSTLNRSNGWNRSWLLFLIYYDGSLLKNLRGSQLDCSKSQTASSFPSGGYSKYVWRLGIYCMGPYFECFYIMVQHCVSTVCCFFIQGEAFGHKALLLRALSADWWCSHAVARILIKIVSKVNALPLAGKQEYFLNR